jgi:hypothetical protein
MVGSEEIDVGRGVASHRVRSERRLELGEARSRLLTRKIGLEGEHRRLGNAVEDVRSQHHVPVLGDSLRLIRERLSEAESVGEVDYCGKRVSAVGPDEQRISDAVRSADVRKSFDHDRN